MLFHSPNPILCDQATPSTAGRNTSCFLVWNMLDGIQKSGLNNKNYLKWCFLATGKRWYEKHCFQKCFQIFLQCFLSKCPKISKRHQSVPLKVYPSKCPPLFLQNSTLESANPQMLSKYSSHSGTHTKPPEPSTVRCGPNSCHCPANL